MRPDRYPDLLIESRSQWRRWLIDHHATSTGIWAVTWKKSSGCPHVSIVELQLEALCAGWIDSQARSVDERRSSLLMTPRRRGSGWSRVNKGHIERLIADGLMLPAGQARIDAAVADGSWTLLDDVENLIEPAALRSALDAEPAARAYWDAFPRSAKRAILGWISTAKRPETIDRRITEAVRMAAENRRAHF